MLKQFPGEKRSDFEVRRKRVQKSEAAYLRGRFITGKLAGQPVPPSRPFKMPVAPYLLQPKKKAGDIA